MSKQRVREVPGRIGRVDAPARELPEEPGVDGAERVIRAAGGEPIGVQQPGELRPEK
jgi:hypothetical protein